VRKKNKSLAVLPVGKGKGAGQRLRLDVGASHVHDEIYPLPLRALPVKNDKIFIVTVVHGCATFFGLKVEAKTHLIATGSRAAFWIISY
jgi:hypothetical protein